VGGWLSVMASEIKAAARNVTLRVPAARATAAL
jgi:hypothetical protein